MNRLYQYIALVTGLFALSTGSLDASAKPLLFPKVSAAFYQIRNFQDAWTDRKLTEQLKRAIREAPTHGLQSENYHLADLDHAPDSLLSDAFFAYAHDLRFGRASHSIKGRDWTLTHKDLDLVPILQKAIATQDVYGQLSELAPSTDMYRSLQKALSEYRELAAEGDWGTFQDPIDLESNANPKELEVLRRRLEITKDVHPDMDLIEGVIEFQRRHGLRVDGIPGKQTIAALSVAVKDRVAQIELNLERLRWMPREFPQRSIIVNVPDFHLLVLREQKLIQTMRIIVGKTTWCTPTFQSSKIHQIILNPFWYVPRIIAEKEIYPTLQKDPSYLSRNHIVMIRTLSGAVQLRQTPGPHNSLGRIKFEFPNCCDCYLHDTPEKQLFDKVLRAFSHGCIRVDGALDLATWVLEEEGWSAEELDAAIQTDKTQTIRLKNPVSIFIVYFTAWVESDGIVQFRQDIYGKDRELKNNM